MQNIRANIAIRTTEAHSIDPTAEASVIIQLTQESIESKHKFLSIARNS